MINKNGEVNERKDSDSEIKFIYSQFISWVLWVIKLSQFLNFNCDHVSGFQRNNDYVQNIWKHHVG